MSGRPTVLVIAASDSSGGAGLTRDVQTLTEFDTPVRCAVTAVTVQTDAQLRATHAVPPELVHAQIRAAIDCGDIGAIKIGALGTAATVSAVADALPPREQIPIVLDPVLTATSGGVLLDAAGVQRLRALLLPRVSLLTPNIPEAAVLLGQATASTQEARLTQLQQLLALGPAAVLLKGGHSDHDRVASRDAGRGPEREMDLDGAYVIDWLAVQGGGVARIQSARVHAERRGTGCSLASAIAAELAAGKTLLDACKSAQTYIGAALRRLCG